MSPQSPEDLPMPMEDRTAADFDAGAALEAASPAPAQRRRRGEATGGNGRVPPSSLSSSGVQVASAPDNHDAEDDGYHNHGDAWDGPSSAATMTTLPPRGGLVLGRGCPCHLFEGMIHDVKARLPYYKDDWLGKPHSYTILLSASVYSFVVQLIPALIFSDLMERNTRGNLSTSEVLLGSAVVGVLYAIFSGQPLVLLGVTGPLTILLGTAYGLTEQFNAGYFPFFFWTCVWAGLLHVVAASTGVVQFVWKVTPFTTQVFELFTAVTFLYSSLKDLLKPLQLFQPGWKEDRSAEYAAFFVGMITFYVAWTLHFAETWMYFPRQLRSILTAYNTLIAVVVGTAISYLPGIHQPSPNLFLERVNVKVPWNWQPTVDRPWLINPFEGITVSGIFGAIIPGIMIFLLFIIDHNVSSILTQRPKFGLKKPSAYHWDFFVLGVTFVPCALMGLPPGSGLLPQAPLHARALCTRENQTDPVTGQKRMVVTHVEEQRWTALVQASLMFVALAAFQVIAWIPLGCLYGLFFYLGCGVLHGNEVWDRITFAFVSAKKRPEIPIITNVPWRTVVQWTAIQTVCAVTIFAVAEFLTFGYVYPVLLALLVPIRSFALERWFDAEDLTYLDPVDDGSGGYEAEQREIYRAERLATLEGEEELLPFPNRAEFRRQVSGNNDASSSFRSPKGVGGNSASSLLHLRDESDRHTECTHATCGTKPGVGKDVLESP